MRKDAGKTRAVGNWLTPDIAALGGCLPVQTALGQLGQGPISIVCSRVWFSSVAASFIPS